MNSSDIQSVAQRVFQIESEAVSLVGKRLDEQFVSAVNTIMHCKGRLIISGMGKSGLISQKIASTMASTGTPSHFVHPGEATHGDLGMITKDDVVLIVSNSGETMELIQIIPALHKKGAKIRYYDPTGPKAEFSNLKKVSYCNNISKACENADLIVIHTEWDEFKSLNFNKLIKKKNAKIFDMRNLYSISQKKKGKFKYYSIGR